jgi:hypothetical protein
MGLLDILALPVTGPIQGIIWLAEKIQGLAEDELYNEDKVRGLLAELELSYDMEEINEAAYLAAEDELLERLDVIQQRKAALANNLRNEDQ